MKSICIGIISYLPDDENIRSVRKQRLESLLIECDEKLKLPIVIIAQNWKDYKPPVLKNSKIITYSYENKLGITKARIKLREKFLSLMYTNIILLDDDMELGTIEECQRYVAELLIGNFDYYYIGEFLNNFSCISRNGFTKINYDEDINPENGTGFEDWVFYNKCKKYLLSKPISSIIYRKHRKEFLGDEYSTWLSETDKSITEKNDKESRIRIKTL